MKDDPRKGLTPPEQIRLTLQRLRGLPFEKAWPRAIRKVRYPHEKEEREEWKLALRGTREAWRAAFEGDAGQLAAFDMLARPDDGENEPAVPARARPSRGPAPPRAQRA